MGSSVVHAPEFRGVDHRRALDSAAATAEAVSAHLTQWWCGLHGHESYLHTSDDRLTLRCIACGHESPGWTTGRRAYQTTCAGDSDRLRLR